MCVCMCENGVQRTHFARPQRAQCPSKENTGVGRGEVEVCSR